MSETYDAQFESLLNVAQEAAGSAAVLASAEVLGYWPSPTNHLYNHERGLEITSKSEGVGNFATEADFAAGAVIVKRLKSHLALQSIGFRSEESIASKEVPEEPWWNVDEIDGTANFSRGSDHFGISIGLHGVDNTPEVGVIAFPARQELIIARRGQRARLLNFNRRELADLTALAARLPADPPAKELFVAYDLGYSDKVTQIRDGAEKLADQVSALKSYHSSSYTLGELCLGKLDAFFSRDPTIYDIGASSVAVEAIGGKMTDMQGQPIDWDAPKRSVLAARTLQIHQRVLDMLNS